MNTVMDGESSYDPVTAVEEATATGKTAAIFKDIRDTMRIPLVTSIWRGLAAVPDDLETVWNMTKPLHAGDLAECMLASLINQTNLPTPNPLAPSQLSCIGLTPQDLLDIHGIIDAYNRSNGLNLVTLSALITQPAEQPLEKSTAYPVKQWQGLPALLPRDAISTQTWQMVQHVNAFGATGIDANVATLWRHLAHWPALLALIHAGFSAKHSSGEIVGATAQMTALAKRAGASMAHLTQPEATMPPLAQETVRNYVRTPTHVVRMVTLGHTLARWLKPS